MTKSLLESSILNTVEYRSLSAGTVPSNEYLIATTVVGATSVAQIDFDVSAYADTYRHLKLVWVARSARATESTGIQVNFNDDFGANYNGHIFFGSGSTLTSDYFSSTTWNFMNVERLAAATATANVFGAGEMLILDPFHTSKNTTMKNIGGVAGAGSIYQVHVDTNAWFSTASVNKINLVCGGGNFVQYSRFSLYGVTI